MIWYQDGPRVVWPSEALPVDQSSSQQLMSDDAQDECFDHTIISMSN